MSPSHQNVGFDLQSPGPEIPDFEEPQACITPLKPHESIESKYWQFYHIQFTDFEYIMPIVSEFVMRNRTFVIMISALDRNIGPE